MKRHPPAPRANKPYKVHHCAVCGKLLATERRPVFPEEKVPLQTLNGAVVTAPPRDAPKLRCPCGHSHIVLKGAP